MKFGNMNDEVSSIISQSDMGSVTSNFTYFQSSHHEPFKRAKAIKMETDQPEEIPEIEEDSENDSLN